MGAPLSRRGWAARAAEACGDRVNTWQPQPQACRTCLGDGDALLLHRLVDRRSVLPSRTGPPLAHQLRGTLRCGPAWCPLFGIPAADMLASGPRSISHYFAYPEYPTNAVGAIRAASALTPSRIDANSSMQHSPPSASTSAPASRIHSPPESLHAKKQKDNKGTLPAGRAGRQAAAG